ncbi:hypothetical protein [Tunturiibacter gelidoferens]|uniref:Outer membrane lipoprotein-sorting protein n=1 Tax=Tunturiibacter gelidiferens TaxID=3069689 RepID=A0A9X0QB11_9BACT|nr:hypothetical protein [Edaphobacter lichenicola]MBB5327077.1 hypothetical protein [Edaphobacter lichenicola]
MKNLKSTLRPGVLSVFLLAGLLPLYAQAPQEPKQIVRSAMDAELSADLTDHSRWKYRDVQKDGIDTVSIVVETDHGAVKRLISRWGRPLSDSEARIEDARVQTFIHDPSQLAKQKRDGMQDGKNAEELLRMLPDAFTWKVQSEDEKNITLHFEPNSKFSPPDMQGRVLGQMAGVLVVDKGQNRIVTISGKLTEDVTIGWGLLGRLRQGGTFRVERREVAPGLWQIVETHVHIEGKALFFKNIGQQQDEIQTDFVQVPHGTTLEQAAEMSKALK